MPSEATKELRRTLGEPKIIRERQMRLEVYDYEADGDGVVLVRLSSQDIQNGETALGQARGVFEFCRRLELAPRHVLVMLNCGSKVAYEQRADWQLLRDGARAGWLRWVAVREADRVSRNEVAAALFYRDVKAFDLRLYMSDLGRQINLDDPAEKFVLNTFTNVGVFEAAQIRKRTMRPIQTRWIEEGRGWPKQPRFGFRRDAQDYLEVDPEQWPFVERIHFDYATLNPGGGTSIRKLQEHVEALGCKLSTAQVGRILRDSIYVDGEWTCRFETKVWPCRRIEIPNPIPREVFERNQALLSTMRGAPSRRPLGYFVLNHVRLLHRGCLEEGRAKAEHMLRGQREDYRHVRCPSKRCWGVAIPRETLDALVIGKLLELCESEELQQAWATRPESSTRDGTPDDAEIESIRTDLRLRRRQLEEANRQWLDASARKPGADLLGTFQRATGVLSGEIETLERRLAHAERLRAARADMQAGERRRELLRRAREVLTTDAPSDPDAAQRRVAFVSQAIDEVIVEIEGDGMTVEIFGPLVERTRVSSADPIRHAGSLLAGPQDCLTEEPLRDSLERRARRGNCDPAWRSPVFRLAMSRSRNGLHRWDVDRREAVLDVLRVISAQHPPGPLPIRHVAAMEQARASGLSAYTFVTDSLRRFGTVGKFWSAALGAEPALRLGRRRPSSVEDWEVLVSQAIDHGLRFGPGWHGRWNDFARQARWLPSTGTLRVAEQRLEFRIDEVVAKVSGAAPVEPPKRWEAYSRPSELEDCFAAIRTADAVLPPGLLSWAALARVADPDASLPHARTVIWRFQQHEVSWHDAIIHAVGAEEALRRGRTRPRSLDEWRIVVRMALAMGLDADRAWPSWIELSKRHVWLPRPSTYKRHGHGVKVSDLVREEATRLAAQQESS